MRYLSLTAQSVFAGKPASVRKEGLADRLAKVGTIRISPLKFVAYQGDNLTFTALPLDSLSRTIQGVKFTWGSSNLDKVEIDNAGRARFLQPGLARITCKAGTAEATAPVLVRPGPRPPQTDEQWRRDQDVLSPAGDVVGNLSQPENSQQPPLVTLVKAAYQDGSGNERSDLAGGLAVGSADLIVETDPTEPSSNSPTRKGTAGEPTIAYPQGGLLGEAPAFDELWSEPKNLVGNPRNRAAEPTALGTVLPEGSNFNLPIPLVSLPGRGLDLSLSLYYNSRVWGRRASSITFDPDASWPSAGFSLGFGRIIQYDTQYTGNFLYRTKYMLIDPDGTRHYLAQSAAGDYSGTINGETTDGYHIRFYGGINGITITYNSGKCMWFERVNNRLLPTRIQDRNGNYITITYKDNSQPQAIDYITDTLGRKVQFNYTAPPPSGLAQLASITAPALGGTAENPQTRTVAEFQFTDVNVNGTFSGLTGWNGPATIKALRRIIFPTTGTGYVFNYSCYGMIYHYSARRQMINSGVRTDGVESAVVNFNYPTTPSSLTDAPEFTQRTESAVNSPTSVYTYGRYYYTDDAIFIIFRPDTTQLALSRYTATSPTGDGLLHSSLIRLSDWVTWRASTIFTYANDGGGSPQVQSVLSTVYAEDGTSAQTKLDFNYDSYGNVTNRREYGFALSGQYQVRRRTKLTYVTLTALSGPLPVVSQVEVFDALENSNDADDMLVAKTAYAYDNYASMGGVESYPGSPAPPGHFPIEDIYYARGNVTGVTQWADLAANTTIQRLAKYDMFGNVVKAQVSCCQEKDLTNTEATYWSQPEDVMSGNPASAHQTTSTDYDFNTSLPTSATDEGGLTTSYGYDSALVINHQTLPTGAEAAANYNYDVLSSTSTTTYDDGGVTKTLTNSRQCDGWGRAIQEVGTNGEQVNTAYDVMGRVASRTNPFVQGGQPGALTTFQYDTLGRATTTTLPGGNTVSNSYSGVSITVTDQVGRKIKRESDGLGRLVKVTEQDTTTSALTQETVYSYNLLDKLLLVIQGGQQRAYKYDALGRMLYERIPEQSATINDGTGVMWSTKYTYTEFNAVSTRKDARGVVTTYYYDGLHRLNNASYDTSAAPGVAGGGMGYQYDDNPLSTTHGLLLSAYGGGVTETYTYDSTRRLQSVTRNNSYTTSYQYNELGQVTQITYPSGLVVSQGYDSTARLNNICTYPQGGGIVSAGVSYNTVGQVGSVTLGNGVVESYGYDLSRLQMTSQSATKSGSLLLSLGYSYAAAAGQNGAGTTAGNTGQLMAVTSNSSIGGVSELASYTYDNVGRLVTSNQTTNGVNVQRRFTYDRWGNRTGVWDAVSGGSQIQSVSLQQSGGAPTNRISSVTSGGTTNYTYDAAGNMTGDGQHTYQYDSENRVVSVDGGATATYSYDHQNRRVSKVIPGVSRTDYIWEGNNVIEEYDRLMNGPWRTKADYVYAGGELVASLDYTIGYGCTTNQWGVQICTTTWAGTIARYYIKDRLSARLTLDASGNIVGRQSHLPFGEEMAASGGQQKQRFTSYERDSETNTDYAVNRQYSQALGRFMRVDPLRQSAKVEAPQTWNRYSYTVDDPINLKDPTGLQLSIAIDYDPCPWNRFAPGTTGGLDLGIPISCGGGTPGSAPPQDNPKTPTCREILPTDFESSGVTFKLTQLIFFESSGDPMESFAIARVILNRLWFLNQPNLTDTHDFGPRNATIEQVLGKSGEFPEYDSNGNPTSIPQSRYNKTINGPATTPDCRFLVMAMFTAIAAEVRSDTDPFAAQGGSWYFAGARYRRSGRMCRDCSAALEPRLGVHWFYTFPYWNYTGGVRLP